MEQEAKEQARQWLQELRDEAAAKGETVSGGTFLSAVTKERIAAQTALCPLLKQMDAKDRVILLKGLEGPDELARRCAVPMPENLRTSITQLFLAEWNLNAATYDTTLEKTLPFTLYNGAVDLKSDRRFAELLDGPGIFKEAITHERTKGRAAAYLLGLLAKREILRGSEEFASLRHISGIFKHAATTYPTDDHAEVYLRRVMEVIAELKQDEALMQNFQNTPWVVGFAAMHHTTGDTARKFLQEIYAVCRIEKLGVNDAVALKSERRRAIIKRDGSSASP